MFVDESLCLLAGNALKAVRRVRGVNSYLIAFVCRKYGSPGSEQPMLVYLELVARVSSFLD